MSTPTTPIALNPNLALWIAGLGFLSSLVVVAINSIVTLKSKKIDAQIKKDEQAYGYKMEYFKRKLSAGEKAVGRFNVMIAALAVIRKNRERYLNDVHLPEDDYKYEVEDLNTYVLKFNELETHPDYHLETYFTLDATLERNIKTLSNIRTDVDDEIMILAEEYSKETEAYKIANPDIEEYSEDIQKEEEHLYSRVLFYLEVHDELVKRVGEAIKEIHKQLKDSF